VTDSFESADGPGEDSGGISVDAGAALTVPAGTSELNYLSVLNNGSIYGFDGDLVLGNSSMTVGPGGVVDGLGSDLTLVSSTLSSSGTIDGIKVINLSDSSKLEINTGS